MATSLLKLLGSPAVFGALLVFSIGTRLAETPAIAGEIAPLMTENSEKGVATLKRDDEGNEDNTMSQVTSVSQLADVQPTDWAFQALQSLVERYGCIAGYPNSTYRGNRALTRYEFAAGLNACLDRVNELIATTTSNLGKQDLATLQRLQTEFSAELATVRGRVDALEANTAQLQANQFSTTTKLLGQVVVGAAGILTGDNAQGNKLDSSTVLVDRVRLELVTSFTGSDLLFARLATGNFSGLSTVTGTPEGELAFTQDEGNNVGLEVLSYNFPLTKNTEVFVGAAGLAFDDFADTVNFLDGDGGSGALSAFGTRNPIYYLVDGAGLAIRHQLSNSFVFSLGYLTSEGNSPRAGSGLLKGPYGALAQLLFKPSDRFNFALTYINAYNADNTGTGSSRVSFSRFDDAFFKDFNIPAFNLQTSSNSYGAELSWHLSDKFVLGGWVGHTNTRLLSTAGGLLNRGDINTWNYAVTLGFPDLGKEGNLLGFVFGMEPKITSSTITSNNPNIDVGASRDTSLHIEGFYQLQLTDNIAVTPGIIWITAPDFNNNNNDIVIGTIRTTFTF